MRANETACVILGGGRGTRLYPLTRSRSKPAVPFGGKYRLIDVPISNCLNAGLNRIFVVTQFQSASLIQHVRAGYRFDRFGGGFVEILAAEQTLENSDWYQGTADAVRQNLAHLEGRYRRILVLSGDQLYHMDFRTLMASHESSGAAMTVAVLPVDAKSASSFGIVKVDADGRIVQFFEKPTPDKLPGLEAAPALLERLGLRDNTRPYLASMGIYLFEKDVLFGELSAYGHVDFGHHLFPACITRHKVNAFLFDGYWEDIGTVRSFHEANIMLAQKQPLYEFLTDQGPTYTRPRTLPVTRMGQALVSESIVADGCRIGSATIERSIVGIRSVVGESVTLRRTLLMGADGYETEADRKENARVGRPDMGIGRGAHLEDAIVDKNARVGADVIIRNPESIEPKDGEFYAVRDGIVCIFKNAVVPPGTRLGA